MHSCQKSLKHLFYRMTNDYDLRKGIAIELSGKSPKNFNGSS